MTFDGNNDGTLSKEELIEGHMNLYNYEKEEAMNDVDEILKKFDTNQNGNVDFSEFLTANINLGKAVGKDNLKEAFNRFDIVFISFILIGWKWRNFCGRT